MNLFKCPNCLVWLNIDNPDLENPYGQCANCTALVKLIMDAVYEELFLVLITEKKIREEIAHS